MRITAKYKEESVMRKLISLFLSATLVLSVVPTFTFAREANETVSAWDGTTIDKEWEGAGTAENPYLITSAAELAGLAESTYNAVSTSSVASSASALTDTVQMYNAYTGVYFKLMTDIDLADKEWLPIGRMGMRFNGNFDGNEHIVKNLYMSKNYFGMGLFGATGADVVISKLGINGAEFSFKSTDNGGSCDLRSSEADPSWVEPYMFTPTRTDKMLTRTFGVGAMIGLVGGGDISDSYAVNVKISNNGGSDHPNSAGFIGGAYAARQYSSSDTTTAATVTNCYVNNLEIAGKAATFESGFCGSLSRGDSTFIYDLYNIAFTNCYVGQVTNEHTGKRDAFCDKSSASGSASKCYSVYSGSQNKMSVSVVSDAATLFAGLTAGYAEDNAEAPINNGYPILVWQDTWSTGWDGITRDTEWTGSGTEEDPYLITSNDELAGLAYKVYNAVSTSTDVPVSPTNTVGMYNAYTGINFKLTTDIDINDKEWLPIGRVGMRFNGIFDGGGHVIRNMTIKNRHYGIGLFGATGTNVSVTNLGIEDAYFNYDIRNGYPSDYSEDLSQTDTSWTIFGEMNADGVLKNTDRVWGTGSLIGIFGGGTVENCYARNIEIKTPTSYSQHDMGGLLGGAYCTTEHTGTPTQSMFITNCYVTNAKILGTANRAGGLLGSTRYGATTYFNGVKPTIKNCYTSGISFNDPTSQANSAFGNTKNSGTTITDTYTTDICGKYNDAGMTDREGLIANLIGEEYGYTLDGTYFAKNGGLPILLWQAPWIYGTDTDFVSTRLINMLTGSQSEKHIFSNMNFMKTAEIGGKKYEFDFLSKHPEIITNTGTVLHKKDAKTVDVTVYVHNIDDDEWSKETVDFTVTPRGIELINDSFDAELDAWDITGDIFTQVDSSSGYLNDKMIKISGDEGTMTRVLKNPATDAVYEDGVIETVVSVYNDSDFGTATINVGGALVCVSKTAVTINGEETSITPTEGWFDIGITAYVDIDSIKVTVGDMIIEKDYDFTTIGSVEIKGGNAKLDNLLVYESVPGELDNLTEELVLNGQDKYEVKSALYLPTEIKYHRGTIDVLWESSDSAVKTDGTLGAVEMTKKVILTAKAYDKDLVADGEKPSNDDIREIKTFEVYVVPVGSKLYYKCDFEGVTKEGSLLSDYDEWYVSTNGKYLTYTIEKDPTASTLETFADSNKVMMGERLINGNSDAPVETVQRTFDSVIDEDVIEISYDFCASALYHAPIFRIWASSGFMVEANMANNNGYFSHCEKIGNGNTRASWKYTPGKWQNHKYIINTREKTLAFYLDGELQNTVRYNTSYDAIRAFGVGSSRTSSDIGKWYVDNMTVRGIMPEDSVAVDAVKNNLVIAETAEKSVELPVNGTYATSIWWESDNTSVIDINGTVTRQSTDKTVKLTAHIIKGNAEATKEFEVLVPAIEDTTADEALLKSIAERFTFDEISDESQFNVTRDLDLVSSYNKGDAKRLGGVNVSWASGNTNVIALNGDVTRDGTDRFVLLTATLSKGDVYAEKVFKVYVPQTGANQTYKEDFEGYGQGSNIEDVSTDWTYAQKDTNGGNARIMADGKDSDNFMLDIFRRTSVDDPDMDFTYNVSEDSTDILVSTMFKLKSQFDVMNITVGGVDQKIVITPKTINIGLSWFNIDLNYDEWYQLKLYYNSAKGKYDIYLDGEKLNETSIEYTGAGGVSGITISNIAKDRSMPEWYIDEVMVRDIGIDDDEDAIRAALAEIELETTNIEWNIEGLPYEGRYGVDIEWISEKPEILTNDGVVTRKPGENYTFKFTARASRNGKTIDKAFTVTVPEIPAGYTPTQEIFEKHMSEIEFSYFTDQDLGEITEDINLKRQYAEGNSAFYGGASIEWSSNKPDVIDSNGKITRPYFDECVTLTATYTSKSDPEIKTSIDYKVTVWAEGTVVFREDFEDMPAEWENAVAMDVDSRWEKQIQPQPTAQNPVFEKDLLELDKPWQDANKCVSIERYIGNGESPKTEYIYFFFDEPVKDVDSVAFSFDFMADTSFQGTTVGIQNVYKPGIQLAKFGGKATNLPNMETKKWYTFTYIIMKSAGIVCALRDGEMIFSDYIYQSSGADLSYMFMDIERGGPPAKYYLDNFIIRDLSSSDEEAVKQAINSLSIDEGDVYENLVLDYTGINRTLIKYSSSDTGVMSNEGKIVRPVDNDRDVSLTATIYRGNYIENKVFNFTVKKADAYTTPFAINSINGTGKKFSSVSVTNQTGYTGDVNLLVFAYDKSDVVAARAIPVENITGSGTITFDEIDLSDVEYYRIEAYIVDKSKTLSNKQIISY